MSKLDSQGQRRVEEAFGFRALAWRPLAAGSVNTLYEVDVTGVDRRVVVRASRGVSLEDLAHEVRLVNLLRVQGVDTVPEFRMTGNGRPGALFPDGTLVSCYKFIDGSVQQPLSDDQFKALIGHLPMFFAAMAQIDPGAFPGRRHFPQPATALERARRLACKVALPGELTKYLENPAWPHPLSWVDSAVVHGDIHARNVIWLDNGRLGAIIDFDRFWLSDPAVEIGALITGTTFSNGDLDERRLAMLLPLVIRHLDRSVWSPSAFVDALIVIALYFFGRVNRHLLLEDRPLDHRIERRDASRACSIARRRRSIEQLIDAAFRAGLPDG